MNLEITKNNEMILEQPIENLELPIRAMNCVRAANIKTIGELVSHTAEQLSEHRNFGQKSICQVEQALEEINLKLKSKNNCMKIELIKESKINDNDWYSVYRDGKYVSGSYDIETAMNIYNDVKNGKTESKIILKSEEIDLSLQTN